MINLKKIEIIKVSVLIPAYNEEKTLLKILNKVKEQSIPHFELEVIVINDGSTDHTAEILQQNPHLYSLFINLEKNGGKGAAVKEGLKKATGEFILFQDADLEYSPSEYTKLFAPIIEDGADVLIGSRFLAPQASRVAYFWHKVGNLFITLLFNIINNTTFTDIYSCYLLFRRSLVHADELKTRGWQQHAEILTLAVSRGKIFYEVPISYHGRSYDEGKKIRARHILSVLSIMFTCKLRTVFSRKANPHSAL